MEAPNSVQPGFTLADSGLADGQNFARLVALFLPPRSLHACGLACRAWTVVFDHEATWDRYCRSLPPESGTIATPASFRHFLHRRRVRCSPVVSLRLENGMDTPLKLRAPERRDSRGFVRGRWCLSLESTRTAEEGLVALGSNWDTMTMLFGRGSEQLRDELQTPAINEILLDEPRLRTFGRVLPTHDYDIAAFKATPREVAATDLVNIPLLGDLSCFPTPMRFSNTRGVHGSMGDGLGWHSGSGTVYIHPVPEDPSKCATHLILAPLHEVHDGAAVAKYEAQLKAGHRPVVLALCVGLPYNTHYHSGMDVGALCGYPEDRELSNIRACLAAAKEAGIPTGELEESLDTVQREASRMGTAAQTEARTAALNCTADAHGRRTNSSSFLRLGLCLILDGHHKLRAAANLDEAVTVMCFGLQGEALTPHHSTSHTNADCLYFDSGAIFHSL